MPSKFCVSSGSLHAVSVIIVKVVYLNRKNYLTVSECRILMLIEMARHKEKSLVNCGSVPVGKLACIIPIFRTNTEFSIF